jgi:non-homologous end joining protein Ku
LKRIEAKSRSKGKDLADEEPGMAAHEPGKVVDIMELLQRSVAAQPKNKSQPEAKQNDPQKAI